jgi:polar amino acid transport system substrate-binding protein
MCWRSPRVLWRRAEQAALRGLRCAAWVAAGLWAAGLAAAQPPSALSTLLAEVQRTQGPDCNAAPDTLARVLCNGVLRVGVRSDYPPFAYRDGDEPRGLEIDLARALALGLGVQPRFVELSPAGRMPALGEARVDVVVAALGHTVLRDEQALFVQPHYYASRTVVVGRRQLALASAKDLSGRTVCVTVGNASNAELAALGARLMLFSDGAKLLEQWRQGGCALAAQDDSLFAPALRQPAYAAVHEIKLALGDLPWGAAVGKAGGQRLANALGWVMQALHADGSLLGLARLHGVDDDFLQQAQRHWATAPCDGPAGPQDPRCTTPAQDSRLQATRWAPQVQALEAWLQQRLGWQVTLAMLKTQVGLDMFLRGMAYSLALVAGAVCATLAVALAFAGGLAWRSAWMRWPLRGLLMAMQSTPLMLLMMFAGVLATSSGANAPLLALALAVLVLGLYNGSNAGQAIAEARASLLSEGRAAGLAAAVRRAHSQVVAFAVNATRGSPAASLIGVPELLTAQTDIAAFSSERVTTFALLLVFYMLLVSVVVWLGQRWQTRCLPGPGAEAVDA